MPEDDMTLAKLFTILYWVWVASEVLLQVFTRTGRGKGEIKDRGSLVLLLLVIFASIWAATWYRDTHGRTMLVDPHLLRIAAMVLLVAGLAIRWTAILTLGRSFSTNVAIHATQTVHKTGLFRWVRHPSYSGMMMIFTALALRTANPLAFAVVLIPISAALLYRMHVDA